MKNRKNYIAKSTATLTQSGLLAALLQHQRRKATELAPEHGRSPFWELLARTPRCRRWLAIPAGLWKNCPAAHVNPSSSRRHGPPNPHLLSPTATDPQ